MSVRVLKVGSDVPEHIENSWRDLCNEGSVGSPFTSPDWFNTFAKNFGKRMEIVAVEHDDRFRALLPVERKWGAIHGLPARKLEGVFNLNTPRFDLIHGPDEAERREVIRDVWEALRSRSDWDVVEFRLVPGDSWLADLLVLCERDGCRIGTWRMDSAPYVSFTADEDSESALARFFGTGRKHLRQELDRRLRRLRELGQVEFSVSHEITGGQLERYFDLEAHGWKGRAGTAVTDDARVQTLHQEFAECMAKNGVLWVYELTLDGRTIAMSLNILDGGKIIHWKTSYDEEFSRYAPGNLLFRKLVADCIDQGIREIDFLSPSTPNKRIWATGEREHVAFYVFRPGFVGSMLWFWKFGIASWLRTRRMGSLSNEPVR